MTWRPTQFVLVNWQNYDRHFHTFLESTEYFSTLWGSPFPVNFFRKGTTGKKVRSINFFVEEGVRELRSQTAPVPFGCFNQSSEDGKIVGQSKSSWIGPPMKPRRWVLSKRTHQLRASSSSTPFHLCVASNPAPPGSVLYWVARNRKGLEAS